MGKVACRLACKNTNINTTDAVLVEYLAELLRSIHEIPNSNRLVLASVVGSRWSGLQPNVLI